MNSLNSFSDISPMFMAGKVDNCPSVGWLGYVGWGILIVIVIALTVAVIVISIKYKKYIKLYRKTKKESDQIEKAIKEQSEKMEEDIKNKSSKLKDKIKNKKTDDSEDLNQSDEIQQSETEQKIQEEINGLIEKGTIENFAFYS